MAPKKAKKRAAEGANSNVFSMFEQAQIQEFKEAFTIMDQNRDGFIDKNDLRDTFAALGRLNVKQEEIDEMLKEAPGPINFTVFLTMFGEKLKGEWYGPQLLSFDRTEEAIGSQMDSLTKKTFFKRGLGYLSQNILNSGKLLVGRTSLLKQHAFSDGVGRSSETSDLLVSLAFKESALFCRC
uniref:Myosin, light chain 2b, regulatory, cardiac, slow n=1 Tax=Paramormyrops kingsleyae TaxID=1676925 RepID=A0A3B3T6I8_9TELE